MSTDDKASMGMNRTGIGTSPIESKKTIEGAEQGAREAPPGSSRSLQETRREATSDADPIGTVPIPTSVKGALSTLSELVRGHAPAVFLDKLGERLAFERTGTRLYDALLAKHDGEKDHDPAGPARADLERFRADEHAHYRLLRDVIEELGADPTAVTPAADVIGVASMGLLQVVTDPRTTLAQALSALLTAELTDNDGWQGLADLARALGKDDLASRFLVARDAEAIHLAGVRRWVKPEPVQKAKAA